MFSPLMLFILFPLEKHVPSVCDSIYSTLPTLCSVECFHLSFTFKMLLYLPYINSFSSELLSSVLLFFLVHMWHCFLYTATTLLFGTTFHLDLQTAFLDFDEISVIYCFLQQLFFSGNCSGPPESVSLHKPKAGGSLANTWLCRSGPMKTSFWASSWCKH